MTPTLRINRLHHPVTALGHGVRAGVWVQGCGIGCHGCASRDTWDADAGDEVDVERLVDWLDGLDEPLDGLTMSGGEPFDQPEGLAALLERVDAWRRSRARPFDILAFSGRPARALAVGARAAALDLCDAVVAGPYVARRNHGSPLRGSDNQRFVLRTPLGRERYTDPASAPHLQVAVVGDRVQLIGIPRRDDLDRLGASLAAQGIDTRDATWTA